jgi:hypothetical protein
MSLPCSVRTILAAALLAAVAERAQGQCGGQPCAGLWVGDASMQLVSDANPILPDFGFDLGIEGRLVQSYFVRAGDTNWAYLATTSASAVANFMLDSFTGVWAFATAPLGYGETNLATTISPTNTVATFLRKTFVISNATNYDLVTIRLQYDDGAVLYLNGSQIARQNMPTLFSVGTPALSARDGSNEATYVTLTTPATLLREGTNVVAVEVHQVQPTNSDMRFDLEMYATFKNEEALTLLPVQSGGWRYLAGSSLSGTNWSTLGYSEAGWETNGVAPLGYGNGGDDVTVIPAGPSTNRWVTAYFRRPFVVGSLAQQSHIDFLLRRDDGAVVYVNGAEVFRSNLPDGPINSLTEPLAAVGPDTEQNYNVTRVNLQSLNLVAGTNQVAVEVHQHRNELGSTFANLATPVGEPFDVRILVHVDSNGTARFLKEVTQMWKDGTYAPAGGGGQVVSTPGHFVLVTDDAKLADFSGIALRDGRKVGRRMSTIGFDFPSNHLDMAGTFSPSGQLTFTNRIEPNFRTNPYRHKFHPDHDNLDARYENFSEEAFDITRVITLDFQTNYPPSPFPGSMTNESPAAWGFSEIGGVYNETITGLHKNPIEVIGSFSLKRVTVVDKLNDEN